MIKYWDYRQEYGNDRAEILALVDRVFSSGRLILGPSVEEFEEHFAGYCGAHFAVGVNSGTDALFLSLKALGIGPGDEVLTVANTAVPTVAAIRAAGATPVFVDVEEDTFLLDKTKADTAMTSKTRCILPVHLYGQCGDMESLLALARARGLRVVEDCAQAAGAACRGKKAGSYGDIGAFSFYPTKVLGGFGDGGAAITNDELLHRKLRRLRFYGMDNAYYSEEEGFNSRLDEVQAAILDFKLARLELDVQKRRAIARRYDQGLAGVGDIALPAVAAGCTHQFYAYTIKTGRRDALQRFLLQKGIETKINYPFPVHLMRGYAELGYARGSLPVTEQLAGRILSLPIYPGLRDAEVDQIVDRIRMFFPDDGA